MIKRIFATLALLMVSTLAQANCSHITDLGGIDESTKAQMYSTCVASKEAQELLDSTVNVEQVDKWAEVSKKFAQAIGIAAEELNVAVNEFLGTTAGKLTAFVIFWQVLGDEIMMVSGISIFLLLVFKSIGRFQKALCTVQTLDEKATAESEKDVYRTRLMNWSELEESAAIFLLVSVALEIIAIIVALNVLT